MHVQTDTDIRRVLNLLRAVSAVEKPWGKNDATRAREKIDLAHAAERSRAALAPHLGRGQ